MGIISIGQCMAELLCNREVTNSEDGEDYKKLTDSWNNLSIQARSKITEGLREYLEGECDDESCTCCADGKMVTPTEAVDDVMSTFTESDEFIPIPIHELQEVEVIGAPTQRHLQSLTILGEFCRVNSVEYIDHGKGESYILRRGSRSITLSVSGNAMDGGYLNVRESK